MTQRVLKETLVILRNKIDLGSVVHALQLRWKWDDMKFRFLCPVCRSLDTSIHQKVNLGRCFSCQRNFNTIDLVMVAKKWPFRKAVDWLMTVKNLIESDDGRVILANYARKSRLD